jgi:hypothetical protein
MSEIFRSPWPFSCFQVFDAHHLAVILSIAGGAFATTLPGLFFVPLYFVVSLQLL